MIPAIPEKNVCYDFYGILPGLMLSPMYFCSSPLVVYGWHGPLSHSHILFGSFQLLIIYLNNTHWLVGNVTLLKMYLKLKSYKIWHLKKNVFIFTVTSHEILFYHRLQCLCNRFSRLKTNETSKLGIAGFLGEESTCRFPSQRASNTETISMSWHHVELFCVAECFDEFLTPPNRCQILYKQ